MTEEQIRACFAHIETVRARWDGDPRTAAFLPDESFVRLSEDGARIVFDADISTDSLRMSIPLVAFRDYEAGVALHVAELDAQEAQHAAAIEQRDRAEYARLRQKFGD